jgi:nitrite reductase/ring-hydroxylating ferredoxin subunit
MRAKIAFLFQIIVICFISVGCGKDEPEIIPDVYVNFDFSLQEPEFTNLNVIFGAVKKNDVGYNGNGVIVFRADQDDYKAFDATCPQHIEVNTSVDLNENGSGKTTCPHCNTVYYLMNNGYPNKGYKLKQYRVSVSANRIYVSNN